MSIEGKNFSVACIGASAGGLKALQSFFATLPEKTGMAFVVVVHLSPEHDSHMAVLLQKYTIMPIIKVSAPVRLEPDHVYIITPDNEMYIKDGQLLVTNRVEKKGQRTTIDTLFYSLAAEYHESAVAILLSGSGNDGAAGLSKVKAFGGLTLAQWPDEAEYDGLLNNAIATGDVDLVLPVEEMGKKIHDLNIRSFSTRKPADVPAKDEETFSKILDLVHRSSGQNFARYKRATIWRRISRRVQLSGMENLSEYLKYIQSDPVEVQNIYKDFLLTVTKFFRDNEAFKALGMEVIPQLFEKKEDSIRVWSCGCATGEETYSVGMLLVEQSEQLKFSGEIQIFASDISEAAIRKARLGYYPKGIVNDITHGRLERFFLEEPGGFKVKDDLRKKIVFCLHNVLNDPPFAKLDLIICRNLLIYLDHDSQKKLFDLFHYSLNEGGYLFLGSSETLGTIDLFEPVNKTEHIYRKKEKGRRKAFPFLTHERIIEQQKPESLLKKKAGAIPAIEEVHRKYLQPHSPAGVIVNADYEVLHTLGGGEQYLTFASGRPTQNLLKVVRTELRLELRSALYEAFKKTKQVKTRPVTVHIEGRPQLVQMIVEPISEPGYESNHVHVLFLELRSSINHLSIEDHKEDDKELIINLSDQKPPRDAIEIIQQLEEEIDNLREQLHVRSHEYDMAVEDLKMINEEQQSNHEELLSTTEELETSKEELKSMNEELNALNEELNYKIEEAEMVNNDLENFIAATKIPTIFLDEKMCVQRFTPETQKLFNIIDTDVGRFISHVTHDLDFDDFEAVAGDVITEAIEIEKEIQNIISGNWYLALFKPFLSIDSKVEGVIITFIDFTRRKKIEEEREQLVRELTKNNKDLHQFSYITSHNLRSPITNLSSLVYLFENIPIENKELREILNDVKSSTQVLMQTVDDLTKILTIRDNPSVEKEVITFSDAFEDVLHQIKYLVNKHNPSIHCDFEEAPSITFNKSYLESIFLNLLTNSIKFRSPSRQIEITVISKELEDYVLLEFQDNGIGLDLNQNDEKLFGLYQKFHNYPDSKGLGLYLVKTQVEALGGNIEAKSEVDDGMTVLVYFKR